MANSAAELSHGQTGSDDRATTMTIPAQSRFGRLRDRFSAWTFQLTRRRSPAIDHVLACSLMTLFVMLAAQMVHSVVGFPTEDPTFIYRIIEWVITATFLSFTMPILLLTGLENLLSERRFAKLDSQNPAVQARRRRWQLADEIRQSRTIFADPNYRYAEEFVARENPGGWQLYMTVYRSTKADRQRRQAVIDLVGLTTTGRYFNSPEEAIDCWVNGFSVVGDHARGMVYQLEGCEYSLRYALANSLYLGVRMEHRDGRVTYRHSLDRFAGELANDACQTEAVQALKS